MSGVIRFHVAGYLTCGDHIESRDAVKGIATIFPKKVVATIHECRQTCVNALSCQSESDDNNDFHVSFGVTTSREPR